MTLDQAIKKAMEYETRIRDIYREAAEAVGDRVAEGFLKTMGDDEQRHLDYLGERLRVWRESGKLETAILETAIPSEETMVAQMKEFKGRMTRKPLGDQKRILSRALKVEVETSDFYKNMVEEMTEEGRKMFSRFLDIEKRHIRAVEMQMDYVTKTGYWFGFKEFDME
jgi:bacterioferritin (cytochrome b1)